MKANQRPNFILVVADQWRGDCLGVRNHPVVETPNLDELAREGVTFMRAYSPSPSCIPARACLATGQTPWSCKRPGYQDGVPWDYPRSMMTELRNGGYQTINVGKTHFFPQRIGLGFEVNKLYDPQTLTNGFESDYNQWLRKETNGSIQDTAMEIENNMVIAHPWDKPNYLHPTEWTMQESINSLKHRDTTRPFFLQIGFHRPHSPYDPPKEYWDMYQNKQLPPVPVGDWGGEPNAATLKGFFGKLPDEQLDRMRRAYYASVTHIDAQIAKLVFWLMINGLYDNTTILFTADHGDLMGDHHMFRKCSGFEGSASVPFIIKPAKQFAFTPNSQNNVPITLSDIMPTLLEEAGVPIPDCVDGSSISPVLEGKAMNRQFVHGEHTVIAEKGWQFVADGRYKFIWETQSGTEYLFDLEQDPEEKCNLVNEQSLQGQLDQLKQELIRILKERDCGMTDGKVLISGVSLLPYIGE